MRRALVGAALLVSGCELLVSVDGLSGGAPAAAKTPDGGPSKTGDDAKAPGKGTEGGADPDGAIVTESRYAKEVLADNPSLYLRFGEAKGSSAVKNEVAPRYAATYPVDVDLGSPGAIAGDPDTAITFNGGILELPPGQECTGASDCVVELWMRIEAVQSGYGWIVDHQLWDPRAGWLFETLDGDLTFERWSGGTGLDGLSIQVKIAPMVWHHAVAVRDSAGSRVYWDGTRREQHGPTDAIPATNAKWTVGGTACFGCSDRSKFLGSVDELAVYEHAIGEERIMAHYATGLAK